MKDTQPFNFDFKKAQEIYKSFSQRERLDFDALVLSNPSSASRMIREKMKLPESKYSADFTQEALDCYIKAKNYKVEQRHIVVQDFLFERKQDCLVISDGQGNVYHLIVKKED